MLISRQIYIIFILLNRLQMFFTHEIEEKVLLSNENFRNKSLEPFIRTDSMIGTPRAGFGSVSYLAVSLLFQLPLMEIIFVMGLIILVLGIWLHFVELKADFFRLRRQFLREQRLRIKLEKEEALRNRTLALQNSTSNAMNGNGVNGLLNQNYGSDGTQSYVNYANYGNNRDYGQHYNGDKLYVQSSQTYPSQRLPPNLYLQPNRPLRRRGLLNQQLRTNINSKIPQNINHQRFNRRPYKQRYVPINRSPQNFRQRIGKNIFF